MPFTRQKSIHQEIANLLPCPFLPSAQASDPKAERVGTEQLLGEYEVN